MDRLLCGDVGFGKTELAMRAAFKVVDNGYQVAVLVPTTILAEQHLRTFARGWPSFPSRSRRCRGSARPRKRASILEGLATGSIDIVIGTHRLAQHDVTFENLGLVIIDEEQRFGVEVKERLKALRQTVDVLTMTATPIPRTLHLSLLGVRDISNLETPPDDRLAIETRVTRFEPRAGAPRRSCASSIAAGRFISSTIACTTSSRVATTAGRDRARGPHRHRPRPDARGRAGRA